MRSVLVDSGPLYASGVPSDQYHAIAIEQLDWLTRDRVEVVVVYPILFEAYSLLLRRSEPTVAHRWLEETIANGRIVNSRTVDYVEASNRVRIYRDQSITLFDALLSVVSERLGIPIWSYDHHFDILRVPRWPEGSVV